MTSTYAGASAGTNTIGSPVISGSLRPNALTWLVFTILQALGAQLDPKLVTDRPEQVLVNLDGINPQIDPEAAYSRLPSHQDLGGTFAFVAAAALPEQFSMTCGHILAILRRRQGGWYLEVYSTDSIETARELLPKIEHLIGSKPWPQP